MSEFCNNNKLLPIRLTVYNYRNNGTHKMYGQVMTTTRDIEMRQDRTLELRNAKGKVVGKVSFNQF